MERMTAWPMTNSKWSMANVPCRVVTICLLPLLICLLPCRAHADTPEETFKKANAAYAEGKFDQAVTLYQSAKSAGLRHWALEYNLGDAYYKTNQLGKSVASYVRAFRLNPGDRDVVYNLALSTTRAGDPIVPSGSLAALSWRLFYFVSLNTLTVAASLLFFGLWIFGALALLGTYRLRIEGVALLSALFVIAVGWLGLRIYWNEQSEGIVVAPVAEIRSGPNLSYPANFTIPEGHHVMILDEEEPVTDWLEIGVSNQGLKGWVPTSSIDVL